MGTSSARAGIAVGVDVGSTNAKVVALDRAGRVRARVCRATPRPAGDLSIDAAVLVDLLEEMILEACGDRFAVAAVCTAGVGEDGVLVDRSLRPLTPALAWFDPRRAGIFRDLALAPAEGIGVPTDPARTLVGWKWAREHSGAERAHAWLALTDFAACRWTGTTFLSETLAARTAAWRTASRTWVADRVAATLGSADLLPPVRATGEPIGELRSPRLREAGVLAEAVVVAGGHDHPVGGWGVDRLHPGAILDSMGTAEVVVAQAPGTVPPQPRIDTAPGIRRGGTTLLRVEELARNVHWAAQDPAVGDALQRIIAGDLAPDEHLHSRAFVPGGPGGAQPRYEVGAPAAPLSRASAVIGALAALGGRAVADIASRTTPGARVFAAGGWARSRGWIAAKQAVTGSTVDTIAEPEVTGAGAALLAAAALGWDADPATALAPRTTTATR